MADPLAITTGALALIGTATKLVKVAKSIWKAPLELQELTEEYEKLRHLARHLQRATPISDVEQLDLSRYLHEANAKLTDCETTIWGRLSTAKFQRGLDPSPRFKRTTLTLHRNAVKELAHALRQARRDLKHVITVLNL